MSESAPKPTERKHNPRVCDPPPAQVPENAERDRRSLSTTEEETHAYQASAAGSPLRQLPNPFGRYQIVKVLGQGGMGGVYLARDAQLNRLVALKTPHELVRADAFWFERFRREAKAAAALNHPHICPIHDYGEIDGIPFLAMAYIPGKPLSAFTRQDTPIPQRTTAALVRKIAIAVGEAHRNGIVHRDLKPSNILINARREPIVMDFGLAHVERDSDVRLTQSGAVVGTPGYMSPEQVEASSDAVTPSTDIYSLGVILFELLTGRLPFVEQVPKLFVSISTAEPPKPSELRPGIDPALEEICLKALAKKPSDRYQTMSEFAEALRQFLLRQLESGATTPPSPAAASSEPTNLLSQIQAVVAEEILEESVPSPIPRRRSWPVWAASGLTLVALLLALVTYRSGWLTSRESDAQPQLLPQRSAGASNSATNESTPVVVLPVTTSISIVVEPADALVRASAGIISGEGRDRYLTLTDAERAQSVTIEALREGFADEEITIDPARLGSDRIALSLKQNRAAVATTDPAIRYRENAPAGEKTVETLQTATQATELPTTSPMPVVDPPKMAEHAERAVAGGGDQDSPETEARVASEPADRTEATAPTPAKAKKRKANKSNLAKTAKPITNSVGMKMVYIPAGSFEKEGAGNKSYTITISKPFYMGMHEVTVGQFKAFVKATDYKTDEERIGRGCVPLFQEKPDPNIHWHSPGFPQNNNHPVTYVSWNDAMAMCRWLGEQEHREYRLPTEAEWIYAARAGTQSQYFYGDYDEHMIEYGNVADEAFKSIGGPEGNNWNDGYPATAPVGSFRPNQAGLFDIHGNVYEWCFDGPSAMDEIKENLIDPVGPPGDAVRRVRGGSFDRTSGWAQFGPTLQTYKSASEGGIGFRVIFPVESTEAGDAEKAKIDNAQKNLQ